MNIDECRAFTSIYKKDLGRMELLSANVTLRLSDTTMAELKSLDVWVNHLDMPRNPVLSKWRKTPNNPHCPHPTLT